MHIHLLNRLCHFRYLTFQVLLLLKPRLKLLYLFRSFLSHNLESELGLQEWYDQKLNEMTKSSEYFHFLLSHIQCAGFVLRLVTDSNGHIQKQHFPKEEKETPFSVSLKNIFFFLRSTSSCLIGQDQIICQMLSQPLAGGVALP